MPENTVPIQKRYLEVKKKFCEEEKMKEGGGLFLSKTMQFETS